jgi:hypothetical protein
MADAEYNGQLEGVTDPYIRSLIKAECDSFFAGCHKCCTSSCGSN